jgi:hypothetical protein
MIRSPPEIGIIMKSLAVLLAPVLVLAACASPQQRTARLLDQRLETLLQPDIAAGRAVVQLLPGAARVTLLDTSLFPVGTMALDDKYPDVRADMVEGLLDPSLMRVQVTDTSALPQDQKDARVRNIGEYFTANGLGLVLNDAEPARAETPPAGLNVTISVRCQDRSDYSNFGYGSGASTPVCE